MQKDTDTDPTNKITDCKTDRQTDNRQTTGRQQTDNRQTDNRQKDIEDSAAMGTYRYFLFS